MQKLFIKVLPHHPFLSPAVTAMNNEEHNHFICPVFDLPIVWHSKLKDIM
jgi:hypothetical protein